MRRRSSYWGWDNPLRNAAVTAWIVRSHRRLRARQHRLDPNEVCNRHVRQPVALPARMVTPSASTATSPAGARSQAIATRGLTKVWPNGLCAVDGIDLDVPAGEFFGLLGPNGAGKTTTIGMLTTRVIPSGGTGLVAGVDVAARPAEAKQVLGVVPQTNTLDRSLSVTENLYYHGRYFGMGRRLSSERARTMLERFRLTDKAGVKVATLSGGMAQRLMVARALMHDPDVVFLDEPTTGLDPQSRIALWELLQELNADGQTILLTTHYMEEADRLCDRIAIMDHGKVLACDTPSALKATINGGSIVRLAVTQGGAPISVDGREKIAGELAKVQGVDEAEAPSHAEADDADASIVQVYAARTGEGLLPRLVNEVERTGAQITDLAVTQPSLERVFIELTGRDLRE